MKYSFDELKESIESKTPLKVRSNRFLPIGYGMWMPNRNVLIYRVDAPEDKIVETIVHELAHYIAHKEFGLKYGIMDDEIMAYSIEKLLLYEQPIHETVAVMQQLIYDAYSKVFHDMTNTVEIKITDITMVLSRVIDIIGWKI